MPFKVSMKSGKNDRNVSGRNKAIRLKTGPRWRGISIWVGGEPGVGAGGDERDQGGGARRAQKRGEG